MRLVRLPRLLHGGEILDVSTSCDGQLVATGGKDGVVSVWPVSLLQLWSENASTLSASDVVPSHVIECHSCPIQCVEFSPSSPCDLVSADAAGNVYYTQAVNTRCTSTLVYPFALQPVLPIIDCSWSHDGLLVAWTTTDCRTCIYDVSNNTFQELSALCDAPNHPSSIQRSISFDPTNNYLATMGDDAILYIYQYAYLHEKYLFRLIHKISRHVRKPLLHCRYRRISWSPDGELLCIPTATKNHTGLVSMVSRSLGWENRVSLVGHGSQCETILFLPLLYTDERPADPNAPEGDARVHNIVATSGSDRILLVWNTTKETPVLVLQNVADKEVVSVLWLNDGRMLFAVSLDGFLSVILFDENELGYVASPQLHQKWLALSNSLVKPLNYKYEPDNAANPPSRRSAVSQIEYVHQSDAIDALHSDPLPAPAPNSSSTSNSTVTVEAGKKPGPDSIKLKSAGASSSSASSSSTASFGPITPETIPQPSESTIAQESVEADLLQSTMSGRSQKLGSPKTALKPKPVSATPSSKQVVTTKNGRKRIQPQLISTKPPPLMTATSDLQPRVSSTSDAPKPLLDYEKPSLSVSEEFQKQCKRAKADDPSSTGSGTATNTSGTTSTTIGAASTTTISTTNSNKRAKRELEPVRFIGSVLANPNTTLAKVRLAVPKTRLSLQVPSKFDGDSYCLDIRNGAGNELKPTRITYMKKDTQLWLDFYPKLVLLVAEGKFFWALTTGDCQVIVYSHGLGKRLMPPLVLGSPILFLECLGDFLMATTCVGEVFVWNIKLAKIKVSTNLAPLLELGTKLQDDGLSKSDNITMCSISALGIPLVTLSNGNGYLYNADLETWQTVLESWWSFGSQYWDSLGDSLSNEQSIVDMMEQKTNHEILRKNRSGRGKYFNKISKNMIMKEGFENLESLVSLAHLENRILCCEHLGENAQFKELLLVYCQRLCEKGHQAKLFEVFSELYGPEDDDTDGDIAETGTDPTTRNWTATVCGHDKRGLLREIIIACVENRHVQRIIDHFARKVGLIDADIL